MIRSSVTMPRLAGLLCIVAMLHVMWLYRRSVVNWQQNREFGDGRPASVKDFGKTKEAIAAGNETLGFGKILVISLD
jgi:hypothetical protein